jgi:hypothetical protein
MILRSESSVSESSVSESSVSESSVSFAVTVPGRPCPHPGAPRTERENPDPDHP